MDALNKNLLDIVLIGMGWSRGNGGKFARLNSMSEVDWTKIQKISDKQGVHTIIADGIENIISKINLSQSMILSIFA